MNTSETESTALAGKSALVVGVGGLGCPAALVLALAGVERLVLADDDLVDETNLHRQILFAEADIGQDKLEAAKRALVQRGAIESRIELCRSRFLPCNALELARSVDVVVEGADNFPTKFLVADACGIERTPVVHGAAIRWTSTCWSVSPTGTPCYRCLFEDLPSGGPAPNCDTAGVMGPVVGFAGALMADLALRVLSGEPDFGQIHTFDGLRDRHRRVPVRRRASCPLCGENRSIFDIQESRYTAPSCAA